MTDNPKPTDQTRQTSKAELLRRVSKAKASLKKLERALRAAPEQQPLLIYVTDHEADEVRDFLDSYRKGTLPW